MTFNLKAKEFVPQYIREQNTMFDELEMNWEKSNQQMFDELEQLWQFKYAIEIIDWCDISPMDFSKPVIFK